MDVFMQIRFTGDSAIRMVILQLGDYGGVERGLGWTDSGLVVKEALTFYSSPSLFHILQKATTDVP